LTQLKCLRYHALTLETRRNMENSTSCGLFRSLSRSLSRAAVGYRRSGGENGAALLETVMSVGFLVAIAMAMNAMLRPVVVEAFEKIATALSSVGP